MNTPMAVRTRRGVLAVAALGGAALLLAIAGTPLLANQTPATVSTTDTTKPDVIVADRGSDAAFIILDLRRGRTGRLRAE